MLNADNPLIKKVEKARLRSVVFFQHEDPLVIENPVDIGVRIVQVTEHARSGGAGLKARWRAAIACAMQAVVTFFHRSLRTHAIGR